MKALKRITKAVYPLLALIFLFQTATDVCAHEDLHTHPALSVGAMLFLDLTNPEDGVLVPSFGRVLIRQGSIDEDACPNYINHFYNPKTFQNTMPKVAACIILPGYVQQTAPARASGFWADAIQAYRQGNASLAFTNLGYVFHLLQDMSSPAHVHNDVHAQVGLTGCQDGDDFENWGWSPNCADFTFARIYEYIQDNTNPVTWQLKTNLLTGLQSVFNNQPQVTSLGAGHPNLGYSFVHALADKVYDFTTFQVTLRDTLDPNDCGSGELKRMFPSLEETTVPAAWWIENVGYSQGQCSGPASTFPQAWWMMSCSQEEYCGPFLAPNSVYCVEGKAYIENTGGGSGTTYEIPENLFPSVYEKEWFRKRYGSYNNVGANRKSMLRIYGDVLYPAAVAYGAGLLQAFLDEAIMPKPITDKPTQVTGLSAQLNGRVLPRGEAASAWFEWGAEPSYGAMTQPQDVGPGQSFTSVSAQINGLSPDSPLHFRIVSSNRFGIRYGTNQTFRTTLVIAGGNTPNAWQITDHSTGASLSYSTNLGVALQAAATTNGWRYSVNARMVDDFGGSKTMTFMYQVSTNKRFLVWFDVNTNGLLTAEIEGQGVFPIVTNQLDSYLYHTHEIRYTNGTANYLFDGTVVGVPWTGVALSLQPAGHVLWGSGSSAGMGQMNFHEVEFEITGNGIPASYQAGTAGNQIVAPNPVTQGWTATPASPQPPNAFSPVSPDFTPYLPLVETLPASGVQFDSAQLNGRVDPRGYPAQGWFEWGEPPNYSNSTPSLSLNGFGWRNLSNNINGLLSGHIYQYKVAASNNFVVVYGANQTLVVPRTIVITASEVPAPGQFRFIFTGTPGTAYEALRSTDLSTNWLPVGEATEMSAGIFEFLDTAGPPPGAFYRIRSP
jgi:hypothetical protein